MKVGENITLSLKVLEKQMINNFPEIDIDKFRETIKESFNLSILAKNIQECESCDELIHLGKGNMEAEILVLLPYHYKNDIGLNELQKAFKKARMNKDYYVTFLLKDSEKEKETKYGHIQKHFKTELDIIKPKMILSFGDYNFKMLEPFKENFQDIKNKEFSFYDIPIFYMDSLLSFELIKSDREMFLFKTEFLSSLKNIVKFIESGYTSEENFEEDLRKLGLLD